MPTYYMDTSDIVINTFETLATSAPSAAESSYGWNTDKVTTGYAPYKPNTVQSKATCAGTEPVAFSQLGYVTGGTLSQTFVAGNWVYYGKVVNDATIFAQTGYAKMRLWRDTNADGSAATQITAGWVSCPSQISFTAGSQEQSFTITTSLSAVTLTNEYLFAEFEWYCTEGGGNNEAMVYWVHNDGLARLVTTDVGVSNRPLLISVRG